MTITFEEITAAWVADEFECWFEPRINLATGASRAMAAVPRWRHVARGVLEPDAFMAAVRARGLDDDFAWLHLKQASAACHRWQRHCEGIPVSVNLGFRSLADVSLAPRIHHILQREGLDPRLMILSVDEAALDSNQLAQVLENLARLRLLGFGVAINDFGMGAMALDRLALAAFTELHIPQQFRGRIRLRWDRAGRPGRRPGGCATTQGAGRGHRSRIQARMDAAVRMGLPVRTRAVHRPSDVPLRGSALAGQSAHHGTQQGMT